LLLHRDLLAAARPQRVELGRQRLELRLHLGHLRRGLALHPLGGLEVLAYLRPAPLDVRAERPPREVHDRADQEREVDDPPDQIPGALPVLLAVRVAGMRAFAGGPGRVGVGVAAVLSENGRGRQAAERDDDERQERERELAPKFTSAPVRRLTQENLSRHGARWSDGRARARRWPRRARRHPVRAASARRRRSPGAPAWRAPWIRRHGPGPRPAAPTAGPAPAAALLPSAGRPRRARRGSGPRTPRRRRAPARTPIRPSGERS